MSRLDPEHVRAVGITLIPERGPESPSDAISRLFGYYRRLGPNDRTEFVAVLIHEFVTLKTRRRVGGGKA